MSNHKRIIEGSRVPHEGDCAGSRCKDCGCCLHCADFCPCSISNGLCVDPECGCSL